MSTSISAKLELLKTLLLDTNATPAIKQKLATDLLEMIQVQMEGLSDQVEALKLENIQLKRDFTDHLTSMGNRRKFDSQLREKWTNALAHQQPIALIILDVDHFKRYIDHYGRSIGDGCLQQVADAIRSVVPESGLPARYGRKEFVILLPNATTPEAAEIAEQVRLAVNETRLAHAASLTSDRVSVSLGIASLVPTVDLSSDQLVKRADAALYRAKRNGRNQVQTVENQKEKLAEQLSPSITRLWELLNRPDSFPWHNYTVRSESRNGTPQLVVYRKQEVESPIMRIGVGNSRVEGLSQLKQEDAQFFTPDTIKATLAQVSFKMQQSRSADKPKSVAFGR